MTGEQELMKLSELKEAAHALFARGRYAECAEIYERILRQAPKDLNARVRHAESCRRAGDRQSAITSYRAAAELLMEQGCDSRARGIMRAALELSPGDTMILAALARMGPPAVPSTALEDERLYTGATGFFEQPAATSSQGSGSATRAPQGHVPPPPEVLRAAEETPAPRTLPSVPTIAPVSLEALRLSGRTMAPLPLTQPVAPGRTGHGSPSLPPVVQGRLLSETPVPPTLPPTRTSAGAAQPAGATATMAPVPSSARPAGATTAPVPSSGRPASAVPPRGGATSGQAANSDTTSLPMVPMPHGAAGGGGDAREPAPAMTYRPELRRLGPNAVALRVSPQAHWVIIRSDSPLEVSRAEALPVPLEQQPSAEYAAKASPMNPASVSR